MSTRQPEATDHVYSPARVFHCLLEAQEPAVGSGLTDRRSKVACQVAGPRMVGIYVRPTLSLSVRWFGRPVEVHHPPAS
jgi:hypothetical protein